MSNQEMSLTTKPDFGSPPKPTKRAWKVKLVGKSGSKALTWTEEAISFFPAKYFHELLDDCELCDDQGRTHFVGVSEITQTGQWEEMDLHGNKEQSLPALLHVGQEHTCMSRTLQSTMTFVLYFSYIQSSNHSLDHTKNKSCVRNIKRQQNCICQTKCWPFETQISVSGRLICQIWIQKW